MLRTGAPRAALRTFQGTLSGRAAFPAPRHVFKTTSKLCTISARRPEALSRPLSLSLVRFQTTRTPIDNIDAKHEAEVGRSKLDAHPETVSTTSSTQALSEEFGKQEEEKDTDMMAGIRSDLKTIRETFSMQDVPREAYYVGMAGVLPYLGTSLSTVYCAWEINQAAATGTGFFMSAHTAEIALHLIEPLQIGYGAVIISFLGAIHWGLEWAGYGGYQGYSRYAIGIVAPAVAWPTILLPAEYALIVQFLAFNFLYYTDSRATKRGWAPSWYAVYRFVLTFIVGSSIVASLISRGHISDQIGRVPGPADKIRQIREAQAKQLEDEENARRKYQVARDEDDEDED